MVETTLADVKQRQIAAEKIVMNGELEGKLYADNPKNLKVIESAGDVPWCIEEIDRLTSELSAREAELEEARGIIKELADDLEGELKDRYEASIEYPSQKVRFDRDMASVTEARAFFSGGSDT